MPAAADHGTDWANTHPISKLFGYKIADLTGWPEEGWTDISIAGEKCRALAAGGEVTV